MYEDGNGLNNRQASTTVSIILPWKYYRDPNPAVFRTTFIMVGAILKESYCNRYFECAKNLPLNIIRDALTGPSSYHEYTGVNYYFAEQQRFIYSN
jgi:hypothetical protein